MQRKYGQIANMTRRIQMKRIFLLLQINCRSYRTNANREQFLAKVKIKRPLILIAFYINLDQAHAFFCVFQCRAIVCALCVCGLLPLGLIVANTYYYKQNDVMRIKRRRHYSFFQTNEAFIQNSSQMYNSMSKCNHPVASNSYHIRTDLQILNSDLSVSSFLQLPNCSNVLNLQIPRLECYQFIIEISMVGVYPHTHKKTISAIS